MKIDKCCLNCNKTFKADTREINRGYAKFCSSSCSAKYNNEERKKTQNIYNKICINCNNNYTSFLNESKYCSKICKIQYYRKIQIDTEYNIKSFNKILSDLPCEICGWNITTRDVHHIIHVKDGGKNKLNNLIVLCPNCHRMAHRNLISKDTLLNALKYRLSHHPELYQEQDAHAGN